MLKHIFLVVFLWLSSSFVYSQNYSVQIATDTNAITIGEQIHITLTYTVSPHSQYQLPVYGEELIPHIVQCKLPDIDTLTIDKDSFQISYTYCVTSFNPGEYSFQIGPILYNLKDTIWTPTIRISVRAEDVDVQADIRDVPPIRQSKYTWFEQNKTWIVWIVASIIFLIVAAGVWWYIQKHKQKPVLIQAAELELPHIRALRLLAEINEKQLCQKNLYKQYYSEISDVLREYFEARLHIPLFERTTDEIIRDVSRTGDLQVAVIQNLQILLHEADLVKFAKYIPSIQQSEIHGGLAVFCVKESSKTEQGEGI